jgi:CheY-like chemotaxis protein
VSPHLILIAEETESTRAFLADQLAADSDETVLANGRQHALQLLATQRPQLVLADLNGQTLGLLDAVRRGEGPAGEIDPQTPVIVLIERHSRPRQILLVQKRYDVLSAERRLSLVR